MYKLPPLFEELPYTADSAKLFEPFAKKPWSIFLDSGSAPETQGRYDIIVADPWMTLVTRENKTEVTEGGEDFFSSDDPFQLLHELLNKYSSVDDLVFSGGALGYFSYDLARRIEDIGEIALDAEKLPEMMVGIYDWAVVTDHLEKKRWIAGQGYSQLTKRQWPELVKQFSSPLKQADSSSFSIQSEVKSNLGRSGYLAAFDRIQSYLHEGDCYQVNLAQRFSVKAKGHAWPLYKKLREVNSAPFCAYMNLPGVEVLSSSPERFLKLDDGKVETKPIKGTRPRSDNAAIDLASISDLKSSKKDRAENLMIVDLLRNDLGKTCATGSVRVPKLFDIESYTTVHHLVSTVTGNLSSDASALSLLRGCFPGGSITGAPKIRSMQIIEELEPNRRGVYCGSIGYIGFNQRMDTNIAIRTMVFSEGELRFWAGGGIVSDSCGEDEYQETFDKAAAMMQVLQLPDFRME